MELATVKGVLAASRVECTNMRWERNEVVSRAQKTKVGVNETLKRFRPGRLLCVPRCARLCKGK